MSLVGKYESPLLDPEPLLSESVVITILDDIISNVSSLKHLEFPKKWRKEVGGSVLHQFLERYNTYLRNQRLNCSLCARVCVDDEDEEEWICRDRDEWYGIQNFTCCGCLNHFCYRDGCDNKIIWCKKCEKECCKSCSAGYYCINCDEKFCNKCIEMKACEGDNCETTFCEGCSKHYVCSFCGELKCQSCDSDRSHCSKCDIVACSECLSKQHWGKDDKCECGEWLEEYGFL